MTLPVRPSPGSPAMPASPLPPTACPPPRQAAGRRAALLAVAMLALPSSARAVDLAVDRIQEMDPPVHVPEPRASFSPTLLPLWREALERPEAEPRRMAIDTISLAARRGMDGFESVVPMLERVLADDPDPLMRRAAATALVAIGSTASAARLAAASDRDGILVAGVVEPALASWDHAPRRDAWLARLDDASPRTGLRRAAIEALGDVGESRAAAPLERIVVDRGAEPAERLAAARSLGKLRDSGLGDVAATLAASADVAGAAALPRVLAVALLARHGDPATADLLARLAADAEPAVATAALGRLDDVDAPRALDIARASLGVPDAGQRLLAARLAIRPGDADAIGRVAPLLGDRNPGLRRFVAGTLADLAASADLRPVVIEHAMAALAGDEWRALEQAALLVGHLDHEPAADRLLGLLEGGRDEVSITAAWALRKLQVESTLAPLLDYAGTIRGVLTATGPDDRRTRMGFQGQQIHQLFGLMRYAAAEDLLREYVPKAQVDPNARSAALWALGLLHEDEPDCDLAPAFAERLADVGTTPPEFYAVRWMAAVGLGRFRAASQLETLRQFAERDTMFSPTGITSYWAVERITGEPMPPQPENFERIGGWFLEPP